MEWKPHGISIAGPTFSNNLTKTHNYLKSFRLTVYKQNNKNKGKSQK